MSKHTKIIVTCLLLMGCSTALAATTSSSSTDPCAGKVPLDCACTAVTGSSTCQHNYSSCNAVTGIQTCSPTCPAGTVETNAGFQCIAPTKSGGVCPAGETFVGSATSGLCQTDPTENAKPVTATPAKTCSSGILCGINCRATCVAYEDRAGKSCTYTDIANLFTTSTSVYNWDGLTCTNTVEGQ